MRRTETVILILLLIAASCGKKDSGTGPEEGTVSYIPFDKVGNAWTYSVTKTSGEPATTSTMVVQRKEKLNGVDVTVVLESEEGSIGGNLFYYETQESRLLVHQLIGIDSETGDSSAFVFSPPAVWMTLPLSVDKEWSVFDYSGKPGDVPLIGSAVNLDSSLMNLTVDLQLDAKIVKKEQVDVVDTKMDAFQMDFNYVVQIPGFPLPLSGKLASFWVVPHVGIARIVLYNFDGSPLEIRVLTSYSVQ